VNTPRSDEDRLKLMELMVFLLQKGKSDAADGFEQIINFFSGSYIHYALTVNPHIYISCIKQFWNTASVKRSDDVTRLQALVDKKKIVISEAVIREILQLDDAEGIVCLPNEDIFAGLAQMGYEKPSTKLTFYKAFFSSQWKFLIHIILQSLSAKRTSWNEFSMAMASTNQVGDLSTHSTRFISPVLTQKVFANIRRVGKGFSRVETPLFEEDVTYDAIPSPSSHNIPSPSQEQSSPPQQPQSSPQASPHAAQKLEIIKLKARVKRLEKPTKVKSSKLRRLRKVEASKRVESSDDMEDAEIYHLDLDHSSKVLNVVTAIASQVSAASVTISAAKPSIPIAAPIVVAAYTRRRKGVIIRDPEEELSSKTPTETPKLKDKGKGILIETPNPMMKKDQIELDAEYARKLHEEINKDHEEINKDIDWDAAIDHNTAGYKMDFFKGMSYAEICPIFQSWFDENMRFLFKSREEMEEEDQEIIKTINETPAQKAAKRKKLNNKPRFKIIKVDKTHQLYISFITLLKNFDREDLENLWGIVKKRFSTSKPTNFSDEYLLLTLKTMFEKSDEQDVVWKSQRSVHGLALLILFVERRYPLSRFTLEQLVNVTRLQVEEESEISLEMLRFTRQQLQEYQQG
nr:hypothetical protein [Tanacetum cinerariifolium]